MITFTFFVISAPRGFIRYYCFATIERPRRSKKSSKKYPIVVKTVSTDISNISNGNEQNSRLFREIPIFLQYFTN
jgi:hypothetical protein